MGTDIVKLSYFFVLCDLAFSMFLNFPCFLSSLAIAQETGFICLFTRVSVKSSFFPFLSR